MAKVIRLQESDLMELVKRVLKEQDAPLPQPDLTPKGAATNPPATLQTVRQGQRQERQDLRQQQRQARQDVRQANRATAQAQQNEVNAVYDILKIRRQIGNLPKTIRDSVAKYQNTQAFQPYKDAINAALAPVEALLNATANVTPPAQPGEGEEPAA